VIAIVVVFLFGVATTVYLSLRSPETKVPDVVGKNRFDAEKILDLMKNRPGVSYTAPYTLAVLYTGLGERDLAFSCLMHGIEERSEDMVFLKVEPALDPLRSDPRFKKLLHQMGFSA